MHRQWKTVLSMQNGAVVGTHFATRVPAPQYLVGARLPLYLGDTFLIILKMPSKCRWAHFNVKLLFFWLIQVHGYPFPALLLTSCPTKGSLFDIKNALEKGP